VTVATTWFVAESMRDTEGTSTQLDRALMISQEAPGDIRKQLGLTVRPRCRSVVSVLPCVLLTTVVACAPPGLSASATLTPSPTPAMTADATDFRRVALNEFVPDLLYEFPISLEIPGDFARFDIENSSGRYIWMRPAQGQDPTFPAEFDKPDTAYFVVGLSLNVGYGADTDRFIGMPDSIEELQASVEAQGIQVRRLERKDLRDFPVLILESEAPYGGRTRTVVTTYLATGIETNTLLIQFYFATGPETPEDRAVWERFESSLVQTKGSVRVIVPDGCQQTAANVIVCGPDASPSLPT
jgi:hypothetical protein